MSDKQILENHIDEWRISLQGHKGIESLDVAELEDHLRDQIDILIEAGLSDDEAFIVAVKRMGELNSISREFAMEYTERLWKQLVFSGEESNSHWGGRREGTVSILLAIMAAIAVKIPELFGMQLHGSENNDLFYARNFSLFVLPFLAYYFVWKRNSISVVIFTSAIAFCAAALAINLMPFVSGGSTEVLAIIHLPIAL